MPLPLEPRHNHGQRARSDPEGALNELRFADDAAFESERPSLALAPCPHHLEALDPGVGRLQRLESAYRPDQLFELAVVGFDHFVEVFHLAVPRVWRASPLALELRDRSGIHAERLLRGFTGIVQVDAYPSYHRLTVPPEGNLTLPLWWAHARKMERKLLKPEPFQITAEGFRCIVELYAIDTEIRGTSAATRLQVRQARSSALVDAIGLWLREQHSRISPQSRPGEKLTSINHHWQRPQALLHDGRTEIDSNAAESRIRPLALNRKNALFAGYDKGGDAWGRVASILETAKITCVEPYTYLKATLEVIASGHPTLTSNQFPPPPPRANTTDSSPNPATVSAKLTRTNSC